MRKVHLYSLDKTKNPLIMENVLKVPRNTFLLPMPGIKGQPYNVCRNVALRSALEIIVHSLLVGAATGFGTTSVV